MFGFKKKGFKSISQKEAIKIMDRDPDVCIVDVRRPEEYNRGHIPGSYCIPEEVIGREPIVRIAGKNDTILVYCRTGRRAKKAAKKLAKLGYTDVREFGGIVKWRGPVHRGCQTARFGIV